MGKIELSEYSYEQALREVLRIRNERQKIYGDDWKLQADWELLAMLKMKLKRLEHFIIDKRDENVYEGKKDTAIDTANYCLFLLQNLIDDEKKSVKKVVKRVKKKEAVDDGSSQTPAKW